MFHKVTADAVVVLHLLWILFLMFGAFIGRRHKLIKILHIGGMGFALFIQIFGWYCPLTYLEVWLRDRHDLSQSYRGSFIGNYVQKIVYLEVSGQIIFIATVFLVLLSAGIYLYKPKRGSK